MSCPMQGEASSSSEVLVSSLTFLSINCNSFCVSTEIDTFKDVTVGLDEIIQHHTKVKILQTGIYLQEGYIMCGPESMSSSGLISSYPTLLSPSPEEFSS
jgi:hypothetical protein